jgi:hypothetical protein
LLIQSPNVNIAAGSDATPVSSTITHADSLLFGFNKDYVRLNIMGLVRLQGALERLTT